MFIWDVVVIWLLFWFFKDEICLVEDEDKEEIGGCCGCGYRNWVYLWWKC